VAEALQIGKIFLRVLCDYLYSGNQRKYAVSHPYGAGNGCLCQLLLRFVTSDCNIKVKFPQVSYCVVLVGLGSLPSFLCLCTAGQELYEQIKSF